VSARITHRPLAPVHVAVSDGERLLDLRIRHATRAYAA
jgi:hypothetical protein